MKTIFLLRHAKSKWGDPNISDFDRPLADRGIKSAKKIGKYLKKKNYTPNVVYCSSALRAKQTCECINRIIKKKKNIIYKKDLYMSDSGTFIKFLKNTKDKYNSAMIISHNPGIENFAIEMIQNKDNEIYDNINAKYPTGGLVIIKLKNSNWSKLKFESGEVCEFIKPREL